MRDANFLRTSVSKALEIHLGNRSMINYNISRSLPD